jgi:HAMP domain-containing protein
LLLVAGTVLVATVAVDTHVTYGMRGREALVLGMAMVATLLGNWLLLRRRFKPLERLISSMEQIDFSSPSHPVLAVGRRDSAEVRRLDAAFERMIARLEAERRAPDRPGPPRRGQPGAHGGVAAAPGLDRAGTA